MKTLGVFQSGKGIFISEGLMVEKYFIKADYRPNEQALTFEGDKNTYWTDERIRLVIDFQYYVYQHSFRLFQKHGYSNLLDVGCGPPTKVKQLLAPHCHDIVLIDQPSIVCLVKQILPHSEFIPANLESIDLDLRRKFDLIICADVLEHLLDPDYCVKFIRRHLAPKGLAVLSTPERDYLRDKDCGHSPKPEHIREWNSAEFADYVTSRGFEIVECLWFPQIRLKWIEFSFSRLVSLFIRSKRWSSCQVIVCRATQKEPVV